jgi:putative spermidine/putrescine transport system substrate-binding protein
VLETAKTHTQPYEWDHRIEGKPAARDIHALDSQLLEKAGTVRDGDSYDERMGAIAYWNAVMDENFYMVQKWNEFIAA